MKKILFLLILSCIAFPQPKKSVLPTALKDTLDVLYQSSIVVNVKDYGAVGDGVTEDATAIQNALTANVGKTVYLPDGTYLISTTLQLYTGTTLLGSGGATLKASVTLGSGVGNPIVETPASNHHTIIDNINFESSASDLSDQLVYAWHGVASSHNNTIRNNRLKYFGMTNGGAIDPSSSHENLIEGNYFDSCYVGVFLTGTSNNRGNIVTNNHFVNILQNPYGGGVSAAIKGEYPYESIISNNIITSSERGINILGSYLDQGKNVISGNVIKATSYGIYLGGDANGRNANTVISNNHIESSSNAAIFLTNVSKILVDNNYLKTDESVGVDARSTDTLITVSNNIIEGGVYSVLFYGGGYYGSIKNNTFIDASISGIYLGGDPSPISTRIEGNRYFNATREIIDAGVSTERDSGFVPLKVDTLENKVNFITVISPKVSARNLIQNSTFDSDDGWLLEGSGEAEISSGKLRLKAATGRASANEWYDFLTVGNTYDLTFTIDSISATSLQVDDANGTPDIYLTETTIGNKSVTFTVTQGSKLRFMQQGSGRIVIDDIVLRDHQQPIITDMVGEVRFDTVTINDYTLPTADGSNGYTMKTDGSGGVTWQRIIELPDTASITTGYVPKKQADGTVLWQPDISTSGSGTFNPDGVTIDTTAGGLARVLPAKVTKWDSVSVKLNKADSTIYLTPYDASTTYQPKDTDLNNPDLALNLLQDSLDVKMNRAEMSGYATALHTHTEFFDTLSYSVNIPDTVIAGDNAIWKVPNNITIVEVSAFTNSGTVTFNIEERGETTPNTAGTDVMTSDLVADTDQQETTTFSNATLDKNDWVALVITSITGDPTLFGVTIYYVKTN